MIASLMAMAAVELTDLCQIQARYVWTASFKNASGSYQTLWCFATFTSSRTNASGEP